MQFDAAAWSRRQLTAIAAVVVLAAVLLAVRLTVPDVRPVTALVGFCAALGALVASFLAGRQVRRLNQPAGLDADRVRRIGEAGRSGTVPAGEDVPAARAVYGVGVGEWLRYTWVFACLLHVALAWGLTATSGTWTIVVGGVLAVLALVLGGVAALSTVRLRARLVALPPAA